MLLAALNPDLLRWEDIASLAREVGRGPVVDDIYGVSRTTMERRRRNRGRGGPPRSRRPSSRRRRSRGSASTSRRW
ncbi:hypothetical protein G7085_11705 [Tessaracoccus sp. HDW20]|uniref:hypothetical protein n=1 Tax=Tessaracoccus coleopterorum TaxID=2714950 RepID=UPI0018D33548|nr:hypothetical protein [Tessaracoccus coleopterorum]NHB85053.1 hypothetical protein [Tessaracoccus coleopterorum]